MRSQPGNRRAGLLCRYVRPIQNESEYKKGSAYNLALRLAIVRKESCGERKQCSTTFVVFRAPSR